MENQGDATCGGESSVLKLRKEAAALDHFGEVARRYILASFKVGAQQHANKLSSPITIINTLGALYFGAAGDTKFELAEELALGGLSKEEATDIFQGFTDCLKKVPYLNAEIAFGMKLVHDEKYEMMPCYIADVGRSLPLCRVRSYNLSEPCEMNQMIEELNSWIVKQTTGVVNAYQEASIRSPGIGAIVATSAFIKDVWSYFPGEMVMEYYLENEKLEIDGLLFKGMFFCGNDEQLGITYSFLPLRSAQLDLLVVKSNQGNTPEAIAQLLRKKYFVAELFKKTKRVSSAITLPQIIASGEHELKESICRFGLEELFKKPNLSKALKGGRAMPIKGARESLFCNIDGLGICSSVGSQIPAMGNSYGQRPGFDAASCANKLVFDGPFTFFVCVQKKCITFAGQIIDPRDVKA